MKKYPYCLNVLGCNSQLFEDHQDAMNAFSDAADGGEPCYLIQGVFWYCPEEGIDQSGKGKLIKKFEPDYSSSDYDYD